MRHLFRSNAVPSISPTGPIDVVAHRGASHYEPENTLAAIHAGIAMGAEHVEIDVQRTHDGALVVIHDSTLGRTTDVARVLPHRWPWRVGDLTLDEIRRLDAGAGEQVPLLSEVVDLVRRTGTGLLLELKAPHLYPGVEADLAAELYGTPGYLDERTLVVESFDHGVMRTFKELVPSVPVGLLGTPPRRWLRHHAEWADQVNPRHRAVGRGYVDAVHAAGMACQVWTVNDVADMRRAIGMGVDGIITNRPDVLLEVLGARVPTAA